MSTASLKDFLDEKAARYEHPDFLTSDPIQIPHAFSNKEDIEVSALLTATIAWGQRKTIIRNAALLMERMDGAPGDFVRGFTPADAQRLGTFVHRTFQTADLMFFLRGLQHIYRQPGGLEGVFTAAPDVKQGIIRFRERMTEIPHETRSLKHIANPAANSSAKRLNMFLRWMARSPVRGVDFGIWQLDTARLHCPLDVHTSRVARKLGLLQRTKDDWKAVEELSVSLRQLDSVDPVKYDFALFGLGVFEGFAAD